MLALVSLGACQTVKDWLGQEPNPAYCQAHPEAQLCKDAFPDALPTGCTTNDDCTAPTAVCETATRTCVECTQAEPSACTGSTPVCGDDDACRACAAHTECASAACLPDGSCADEGQVAYVAPTGTNNTSCTRAQPCTKIASALATNRPYVKLSGTTDEGNTVTINNQNVTLIAEPGSKLVRTSNGIVLEVKGTSQVTIYDLEISGGSGAQGIGISMPPGNTAMLSLVRAKVIGNAGGGISASGGTLKVSQSTISLNAGGGISISGSGATFDLTNNFIYRNGDQDTGTFGGLNLGIAVAGTNRLAFNTIVDNRAAINSAGVICNAPSFMGPNNIIARNALAGSTTAPNAQTSGACTYPTSTIANDVTTLAFAHPDMAPFDYHLTAASSAIDQATTATTVMVDFDGDVRPHGAAPDQGADERW